MDQLNAKNVGGPAKVAILLGTYNGQQYLAEQLDSFAIQTHGNWAVWASDDGSSDATLTILEGYQSKWPAGRLSLLSGPKAGFEANFLALICNKNIEADYYAYSDQDDIWEAEKLERAVHWLKSVPSDMPALYCGRTRLVNGENKEIGLSPLFSRPPCFANALIQSIAGGNTMVFNQAARDLMHAAGQQCSIITHDWWTYMVVTGCGGKVFYDEVPTLRYRQHEANVIGMNDGWRARFKRLGMQWQGRFRVWNNVHIEALRPLENRLTAENREIFRQFVAARKMSLLPRLFNLNRSGVHRQTRLGNIGLLAAAIFNKV